MNSPLYPATMPIEKFKSTLDESFDEESRLKTLERNRRAASKCRQRKKKWVEELIQKTEKLSQQNEYLRQVVMQLREETDYLKAQLAQSCQCKAMPNQAQLYIPVYRPYPTN
ncbi:hypothetical protein K501DRAFT_337411 [Backusella circina FSU 941]|nr:hypothetical protein K501DRAFT_337411 [Backusella circina FSU 941]